MYTQNIIFSYDLGVDGDYKTLYKWLDTKGAKECGDSVCIMNFQFHTLEHMQDDADTKKALQEIYSSLKKSGVDFRLNDRIYVASVFFWKGEKSLKGGFIIGKRKPNPWDGFSGIGDGNFEVE